MWKSQFNRLQHNQPGLQDRQRRKSDIYAFILISLETWPLQLERCIEGRVKNFYIYVCVYIFMYVQKGSDRLNWHITKLYMFLGNKTSTSQAKIIPRIKSVLSEHCPENEMDMACCRIQHLMFQYNFIPLSRFISTGQTPTLMLLPSFCFRAALHLEVSEKERSKVSPAWKTPRRQTSVEGAEAYLQLSSDTSVSQLQMYSFKAWLNSSKPLKHKFFWEFLLLCNFSVQYNPFPLLTIDSNIWVLRLP